MVKMVPKPLAQLEAVGATERVQFVLVRAVWCGARREHALVTGKRVDELLLDIALPQRRAQRQVQGVEQRGVEVGVTLVALVVGGRVGDDGDNGLGRVVRGGHSGACCLLLYLHINYRFLRFFCNSLQQLNVNANYYHSSGEA